MCAQPRLRAAQSRSTRECARSLRRAQVLFDDTMLEEIIYNICKSQTWKNAGYSAEVRKSCAPRVKRAAPTFMHFWKGKTIADLQDPAMARWLITSTCTQPKIKSCSFQEVTRRAPAAARCGPRPIEPPSPPPPHHHHHRAHLNHRAHSSLRTARRWGPM